MKINFTTSYGISPPQAMPNSSLQDRLSVMCFLASLLDEANKETAAKAAAGPGSTAQSDNILVMLADDDCDDRELFTEVISEINTNIQVRTVPDGLQLMNILNAPGEVLPAMIFLDLNMPGKSGKECLLEIRNNSRFKDIPVVIYSTSVNKRDIQETHGIGANLYVSKPNTFKGLVAVVAKVFSLDLQKLKLTPPISHFVLSPDAP